MNKTILQFLELFHKNKSFEQKFMIQFFINNVIIVTILMNPYHFELIIFFMMEQQSHQLENYHRYETRSLTPESTPRIDQPLGRHSSIRLKLPDYERFTKVYPIHLRDLTKYDSLVNEEDKQIEISPLFAWSLLLLKMFLQAMVPCWLMADLKYQSMTQNSWRFLACSLLTLPFVAYQKRKIAAVGGNILSCITSDMVKKNFMSSINICIWFLIVKYAVKLTSMIHTFNLMSQHIFVAFVYKLLRNNKHHNFEIAGAILILVGICITLLDSLTGEVQPRQSGQIYMSYSNLSRVCGDILSISGSFISVYLSEKYETPTEPRFLNLFIFNFFIGFNFIWFGYFFGGSDLSFDEYYGVFGVLTRSNLPSMFYVGIMLGFNLTVSNVLLNQIFSSVILRISTCFNILIIGFFCHILKIQFAGRGIGSLSFGFIIPGMILIISGQNILENKNLQMNFVIYRPAQKKQNTLFEDHEIEMQDFSMRQTFMLQEELNRKITGRKSL